MAVGTGDSMRTISFYRKCGFHYSHTVPDFFTINYDHPIEEDGKILKDMLYFRKYLTLPQAICKNARTEDLILSLLNLWKESVKASHHFLTESDVQNLIPDVCLALKSVEDLVVLHYKREKTYGYSHQGLWLHLCRCKRTESEGQKLLPAFELPRI